MHLSNGTLLEPVEGAEGQRMKDLIPKISGGATRVTVPGDLCPDGKPVQYILPDSYQHFAQEYLHFQVEHIHD